MAFRPPIAHMLLAMHSAGNLDAPWRDGLGESDVQAILTEAGRFAADRMEPLNRVGDLNPSRLVNGTVATPPGWQETYSDWCKNGWNSLTGPAEFGGQGLPMIVAAACTELWNAASLAFALCPLLTTGAIEAISAHATEELKKFYLPKMISGEWSGTMNLTEPQSGSDLSQIRCKARRNTDSTYFINGAKIFITYGDHDCTSNIVHLVLARLEDAPSGTRGISLFLVPKILPDGTRNDLRCHSLEEKLGIHASPTCAMMFGDNRGATGWLIGEENRGLNCMFTMMNNARLLVGVQGVALAERAMQAAFAYARDRKQGRTATAGDRQSAIVHHPDVKRMLMDMRVKTAAARMLCMATAAAIDESESGITVQQQRAAHARASLMTPLAKAYSTDIAVEVASSAVQVHGGMGFMEETGVAQFYRDARILPIYEGTNGIQAIDLVTRKLSLEDGQIVAKLLQDSRNSISKIAGENVAQNSVSPIGNVIEKLIAAPTGGASLAIATPFLRALATVVAAGHLAEAAIIVGYDEAQVEAMANAQYFIATELPTAITLMHAAAQGAEFLHAAIS